MTGSSLPFDGTKKRLYIARGRVSDETGQFLSDIDGKEIFPGVVVFVFDSHIGDHDNKNLDVRLFFDLTKSPAIKGMENKKWFKILSSEVQDEILAGLQNSDDSTLLFTQYIGGDNLTTLNETAQFFLETAKAFGVKNLGFATPALPNIQSDRVFPRENMIPHFPKTVRQYGEFADNIFSYVYHSNDNIKDCEDIYPGKFNFISPAPTFDQAFRENLSEEEYDNSIIVSPDGGNKLYLKNEDGSYQNMPASAARCIELLNARFDSDIPTDVPYAEIESHPIVKEYLVIFGKTRHTHNGKEVEIEDPDEEIYQKVKGKICIMHDDIVNSGKSAIEAAETLRRLDATQVIFSARNAVLPKFKEPYGYPVGAARHQFDNATQLLLAADQKNGEPLIDRVFLLHSLRKIRRMMANHLSYGEALDAEQIAAAKDRNIILSSTNLLMNACAQMCEKSWGMKLQNMLTIAPPTQKQRPR